MPTIVPTFFVNIVDMDCRHGIVDMPTMPCLQCKTSSGQWVLAPIVDIVDTHAYNVYNFPMPTMSTIFGIVDMNCRHAYNHAYNPNCRHESCLQWIMPTIPARMLAMIVDMCLQCLQCLQFMPTMSTISIVDMIYCRHEL